MSIKCPDSGIQVGSVLPKGKTMLSLAYSANFFCVLVYHISCSIFVEPSLGERDIVVTTSVGCMCVVRPSFLHFYFYILTT